MDPWQEGVSTSTSVTKPQNFEDNFNPTTEAEHRYLPDSEQYLNRLENKLRKIRADPSILAQLRQKREACMRSLLNGDSSITESPGRQRETIRLIDASLER